MWDRRVLLLLLLLLLLLQAQPVLLAGGWDQQLLEALPGRTSSLLYISSSDVSDMVFGAQGTTCNQEL
jgi:hypothetical protein